MKCIHITGGELEIMQVVWEAGRPVTSHEIMQKLPDKKLTTIVTLAGRLIDKGALTSQKQGRSHAHQYCANLSEEEYRKMQTQEFVSTVHKGSAKSLLSALFDGDGLTPEDVAELKAMLEKKGE